MTMPTFDAFRLWARPRQKGRCYYCGCRIAPAATLVAAERRLTAEVVEHKTPRSRGGTHDWSNLVLACNACDQIKGAMTDAEFLTIPFETRAEARLRGRF